MLETTDDQQMSSGVLPSVRSEAQFNELHRPTYHFVPPANWMNDPNGLIYWNDQYHLFYQYNPVGPFWGTIHWGHAVSDDLLHWQDLPIALTPSSDGADADGCWSGCAIDNDGIPTLVYTGVQGNLQLPCLATSRDGLRTWDKHEGNPVLKSLPPDLDLVAFRDPMVWREGRLWYMLVGSGIKDVGGAALLFQSVNLTEWVYLHPLAVGDVNRTEPVWPGPLWECPQLITLGDKYLLTFGVWHNQPRYTVARIGSYANQHFTTLHEQRLDYGDDYFYAPQTLVEPTGRALMWGWIREGYSEVTQLVAGWAGVMSLPRVLSVLPDNTLGVEPAPELKNLRGPQYHFEQIELSIQSQHTLAGVQGDCLEIMAEVVLDEQSQFMIAVRCSPDEKERTVIGYDHSNNWLELQSSSLYSDACVVQQTGGTLSLETGEPLRLHIFVDRSVIEVFANGRACITSRIYPNRPDSLNVILSTQSERGVLVRSLDVWKINSIWENL